MQMLNSMELLKEYILLKLGAPVIDIEVDDTQIEQCVYDAIQKFSEFALEGQLQKTLILPVLPGVTEYLLDEKITSVIEVATSSKGSMMSGFQIHGEMVTKTEFFSAPITPSGQGPMDMSSLYGMLARFSAIENMFNITPNFDFSAATGILSFTEDIAKINDKVLLHCYSRYPLNVNNDRIFNHQWVKDYSVALTKQQWGANISKYSNASLINGATLNYDRILSEANSEIEKLEEQLKSTWSRCFGIIRG
jgi:hypothetical protein